MVQFAGFAARGYGFTARYPKRGGLPHSDIRGSPGARPSPRLFAACHVLHRLSVPRHPPDALLVLRPRPAPSTQDQRPDDREQMSDHPCRPPCAIRGRAHTAAPPMRVASASRIPMLQVQPRPLGRWPDLLHGHDSLHDFIRSEGREQTADHSVRRTHLRHNSWGPDARRRARDFCPLFSVLCHLSLVGLGRFERPTSRLSGVRSDQLSYRPKVRNQRPELR
jgi:hypothetical protein